MKHGAVSPTVLTSTHTPPAKRGVLRFRDNLGHTHPRARQRALGNFGMRWKDGADLAGIDAETIKLMRQRDGSASTTHRASPEWDARCVGPLGTVAALLTRPTLPKPPTPGLTVRHHPDSSTDGDGEGLNMDVATLDETGLGDLPQRTLEALAAVDVEQQRRRDTL